MLQHCAVCQKIVEEDGFCAWHGIFHGQWLCDQHVHELRSQGQELQPKKPMTREDVEHALRVTEGALKNMAMVYSIVAVDASGASRGFDLVMTYKQSRPILQATLEVLRVKLTAFPPPPEPVIEVDP